MTCISLPLIHGRIVDAQATKNCKCFKYADFTIRKLRPVRVHINQHPNHPLLAVHNWHAQNALRVMRNVVLITLIFGMVLEPVGRVGYV